MADEFFNRASTTAPSRGGGRGIVIAVLAAFMLGAGGVGYLAWAGLLPLKHAAPDRLLVDGGSVKAPAAAPAPLASAPAADEAAQPAEVRQEALEARIAGMEQRLAQIDLRTEAASGNSARSEGLLVAFAARRALDRGAPLGLLEDQLRLRFADAQPNAVNTVITAAKKPVTLDSLVARLESLAPSLSATPAAQLGTWDKVRHELSNLFVIRHDSAPSPAPANRLDRARLSLEAGRIEEAVAEVQKLPGAGDAESWIADARSYAASRAALDLIETTALLDTRSLRDATGNRVEQVSPAATPAPKGTSAAF